MCGLIGWISKDEEVKGHAASDYVAEQYEDQKSRGSRGFGVVEIHDDGAVRVMRSTGDIKMMVDLRLSKARHLFLHHRYPTSTDNYVGQTHPIVVTNEELKHEWLVMHNGVIRNHADLKKKHEELGYTYLTAYEEYITGYSGATREKYNDSEAFAIELVRYFEGKGEEIGSFGAAAFIAIRMKEGKVDAVIIGTNGGNPLKWADMGFGFQFASEDEIGDAIKSGEAVTFRAKYKDGKLLGFPKASEDLPEMKWAVEPPIPSSYYNRDKTPVTPARSVGFGASHTPSKITTKPSELEKNEDFISFGHIFRFLADGPLGAFLADKEMMKHDAVSLFEMAKFRSLFEQGRLAEAENLWDDYLDTIGEMLDAGEYLSAAMLYEPEYNSETKLSAIIEGQAKSVHKRMGIMAEQLLPLFKLVAFVGAVLRFGWRYEKEPGFGSAPVTNLLPEGKKDLPVIDVEAKEVSPKASEDKMTADQEASAALDVLASTSPSMDPDSVLQEAEMVGDLIRTAITVGVEDQLLEVQALASEQGIHLSIPYHFTGIRAVLETGEKRFQDLAKIVKAAHDLEDEQLTMDYRMRDE